MNWKVLFFCKLFLLISYPCLEQTGKNYSSAKYQIADNMSRLDVIQKGRDHALFFAVDEYQDSNWTDLKYPISEVDSIAGILKEYYNFDTTIYRNPTRSQIETTIKNWQSKYFTPNAQLFVFFSGHGIFDDFRKKGYFVPSNGNWNDKSNILDYSDLGNMVAGINCKHLLLGIDACYSGTIDPKIAFRGDRNIPDYRRRMAFIRSQLKDKSRLIVCSGGKVQTPDKSRFAAAILNALKKTCNSKDGILSYHDLVAQLDRVRPKPYNGIWHEHEGGGFVFVVRPTYFYERAKIAYPDKVDLIMAEIDLGLDLFEIKKYDRAFSILYRQRHSPFIRADSWNRLGIIYASGLGTIKKDVKKAQKWFEKAAEINNAEAQYNLGQLHELVYKDKKMAIQWYQQSAENGNVNAQLLMGLFYYRRGDSTNDRVQAFDLFKRAAERGQAEAQARLGTMYLEDIKEIVNLSEAKKWLKLSVRQGNAIGAYNLAVLYEGKYGNEKDILKAIQLYRIAAAKGLIEAQSALRRLGVGK